MRRPISVLGILVLTALFVATSAQGYNGVRSGT